MLVNKLVNDGQESLLMVVSNSPSMVWICPSLTHQSGPLSQEKGGNPIKHPSVCGNMDVKKTLVFKNRPAINGGSPTVGFQDLSWGVVPSS